MAYQSQQREFTGCIDSEEFLRGDASLPLVEAPPSKLPSRTQKGLSPETDHDRYSKAIIR